MLGKVISKIKYFLRKTKNNFIVRMKIFRIKSLKKYPSKGTSDWLEICELKMGGIQKNVRRIKVSGLDPRSESEIQKGGMIGGDRMLHHNYSKIYAPISKRVYRKRLCTRNFRMWNS